MNQHNLFFLLRTRKLASICYIFHLKYIKSDKEALISIMRIEGEILKKKFFPHVEVGGKYFYDQQI